MSRLETYEILGSYSDLLSIIKRQKADRIIVALDDRRGKLPVEDLVSCKFAGVSIDDSLNIQEELTGKIMTSGLYPSWLIFSDGFNQSRLLLATKRLLDIILSSILLIISLPIWLIIPILIKIDSAGPVFFSQRRVGEKEKIFKIFKFRSMRHEAEKTTGPVWCDVHDDRITRVGNFIRRSRIDELPQLYNILKGDMSFVGPRPERPSFVKKLKEIIPFYSERFAIKPGLTGWAQINYPYGANVEDANEKLEYDLFYIKHLSVLTDLIIVLRTAKVVLLRFGSR